MFWNNRSCHKHINTFVLPCFLMMLLSATPALCTTDEWPETQLFIDYPWLAPPGNGWLVQEIDLTKGNAKTSLGALGVGNGRVFGLMGLDMPQNGISNMIGPGYETSEQFFGPVWHELVTISDEGQVTGEISFDKSRIYRAPGTGVIVVQEMNSDFLLTTLTYTLPHRNSIQRIVSLKTIGAIPLSRAHLIINEAGTDIDGAEIPPWLAGLSATEITHRIKNKLMTIEINNGSNSKNSRVMAILAHSISDTEHYGLISMYFWDMNIPPSRSTMEFFTIENLEKARNQYQYRTPYISVDSDESHIGAFIENTLALLQSQTEEDTGAVAVMARYSGAWCRDAYGPIRFYLKAGKYKEAQRIAAFYDYASRIHGFRNRYPVDTDLRQAPKEFDWSTIKPQQGDDPNVLIMHIYNVWRATADDAFIKEHYGFMRRNLMGQDIGDWHLPFHGDETYQVYIMMQEGAPMDAFYSVDTSFWYAVAAESLAEMADVIGETADAAEFRKRAQQCREHVEKYYWDPERGYYIPYVKKDGLTPATSPFANINLRPLWMGYAQPSDPNMRQNVIATAKMLMKETGTMKTTKRVAYYTGMTPGLLLWNLKAIGLTKRADMAFDGLFQSAMSPLGDFAEAYDGNDRWLDYTHLPNVYRPWETAINADAVLYYLTGYDYDHHTNRLTLQPHLPPGVNMMAIDNLYAGPNKVKLSIMRSNEQPYRMDVTIENTGAMSLEIELLTEIIGDEPAADESEVIEYENYQRKMWRRINTLEPGDVIKGTGGLGE